MSESTMIWLEEKIIGNYTQDGIQAIINYLQKRYDEIQKQIEEEYLYDNYTGEELKKRLEMLK